MNYKSKCFLVLFVLTLLAGFLRFYKLDQNPPSLSIDEVSYGYSAYSILKTGRDENDVFMPLVFRSTGDYKNPVLAYLLVPSIALFGLNEFGVRFPAAFLGTLSIPIFFFLIKTLIKKRSIALIGALSMAISPTSIYFSRASFDGVVGVFFLILGMWFFIKMIEGRLAWGIVAAVTLALSVYSYHSLKLFIPLFIISLLFLNSTKIRKKSLITFILLCFILALPMLILSIFGNASTRAGMVFLTNDIEYTRYVVLDHLFKPAENLLLFFFWIKRYLNYFQPDFLFFNGLGITAKNSIGLGFLYLFDLPFLILGILSLLKKNVLNKRFIIWWILLGLIPASLANNEQSAVRCLLILPGVLIVVAVGIEEFFNLVKDIKSLFLRASILSTYSFFIIICLIQALLIYWIHFPYEKGEAFMEGTKQTVLYALANKDKYKEIVFDPYRGIEAPYIVNIPYMYILFYAKYDPALYQQENKIHGDDLFSFDKFTIRKIDWRVDRSNKGILFIGSPWSLPLKDLKQEEILQKVHLTSGDLALLIVSPKN